jgi:uncharacterized membrane protein
VEDHLITAVDYLRLVVVAIGAAVVGYGAIATAARFLLTLLGIRDDSNAEIRLFLGRYLALGLEFQIGADILSTAVLNYFLSKELERERQQVRPEGDAVRG